MQMCLNLCLYTRRYALYVFVFLFMYDAFATWTEPFHLWKAEFIYFER